MIALVALTVVVVIGGSVAAPPPEEPCHKLVKEGSDVLYRNHCPEFKKMVNEEKKVEDYMKCLNASGFAVYDGINKCIGKPKGTAMPSGEYLVKGVCSGLDPFDATEQKNSQDLMCCIITAEVIPMKKTGADKVDISRKCIDQVNSKCSGK